jgi:hypothetical protein
MPSSQGPSSHCRPWGRGGLTLAPHTLLAHHSCTATRALATRALAGVPVSTVRPSANVQALATIMFCAFIYMQPVVYIQFTSIFIRFYIRALCVCGIALPRAGVTATAVRLHCTPYVAPAPTTIDCAALLPYPGVAIWAYT